MNTILPALEVLCKEGMKQDSPLKIRKAIKEIRRDSKRFGWTDDVMESMPPEWQWRVCTARIQLGYLDWRGWEWRTPRAGHDPFDIPRWKIGKPAYPVINECREPEKVENLLIYSEQGIGDQLMFAQALEYVRPYAKNVTLEIEPRLAPCFERSFPWLRVHALKDLRDSSWVEEGEFDAKILMGDVVARFIRSKDKFLKDPYIKVDPKKRKFWRKWLEQFPRPWVGFSWAGRQGFLDYHEDGWINLQYGDYEIPDGLHTPPCDLKEDIEDIFGIISNLDKVITVPNTLAHMAGVVGLPCEVIMTPGKGEVNNAVNYRWGMPDATRMPWHPSIKIYRNERNWLNRSDTR